MTNITRKVVTGLTTGALLLSTFTTVALADTNGTISGNAQGTDNSVTINANNSTTAVQSNSAVVSNTVNNTMNTGGNKANDNVGLNGTGNVSIATGSTASNTTINNALNSNAASIAACGCSAGSTNVAVSGNGKKSDNDAVVNNNNNVSAFQGNTAVVANAVNNNANTGNNKANDNVGGSNGNGGVSISTGGSLSNTTINTAANANVLQLGSLGAGASAGNLNLTIASNLEKSDNDATVNDNHNVLAEQDNTAYVSNAVNNNANTGGNNASDDLGMVAISTGGIGSSTAINNAVNYNAAAVSCGCMTSVNAKIAGNGKNSDNDLHANLGDNTSVFQGGQNGAGNTAVLNNAVGGNGNTGNNASNDNVGGLFGDPSITTGFGWSNTTVNNAGNVNTIGPVAGFTLPSGSQFQFSWDMNGLMGMFGM